MTINKFLEKIFSIKNIDNYKVIKFLNMFEIKISRKYIGRKYLSLPIENNKIVFTNFGGGGYGCNPKYIAREIINQNLPYKLVWLYNYDKGYMLEDMPKSIELINYRTKDALKELMTAKIIISNIRLCDFIDKGFVKKEGQIYIQTWHGSLGIKKIDGAVQSESFKKRHWCEVAKEDSMYIDYLISNSDFENNVFKTSFWYNGKIAKIGHPRNDIFFYSDEKKSEIKSKVCKYLGIDTSKKILLYAPSFRDNYDFEPYTMNVDRLLGTVNAKFGSDWVFIAKIHPNMLWMTNNLFNFNNEIKNGSLYSDIQELLVASDILISDYSSLMFDFMLTKKPVFVYATDIEKYNTDRGFYYPLESTPFPVSTNNEELIQNINNFDLEKYMSEIDEFLKDKGCIEDGQASKRVVEYIKSQIT